MSTAANTASQILVRRSFVSAKAVGSFVPTLTRKAFEKYGFSAATLLTDWTSIVGAQLAACTAPERLKWPRVTGDGNDAGGDTEARPGATLVLRVNADRALDIEYRKRDLIERINVYFGYRAIADVRIFQAPVAGPKPRDVVATPRRATHVVAPAITPALAHIADDGLRAALELMQAGIATRSSHPRR